jgi:integrase/recombinase XerD
MSSTARRLEADLLSQKEIDRLLRACSRRAPTGVRNTALITLLWRTGLRISEALSLHEKDIDLDTQTLIVQRGKGGTTRVVGLDAGTVAVLERRLAVRRKRRIPRSSVVFCTLQGKPIDPSYVRHLLPRLARKAGIEKRTHAHGFRHRFALDLVQEGADLVTVQKLLGHSAAATTSIYLSRIGASSAVEFARNRTWMDALNKSV